MPKEQAIGRGPAKRQPRKRQPRQGEFAHEIEHSSANPPDKSNARLTVTGALRFHRASG
jgi:hypothetical protein